MFSSFLFFFFWNYFYFFSLCSASALTSSPITEPFSMGDNKLTKNSPVGIFWDLESCGVPSNVHVVQAIKNICGCVSGVLDTLKITKFTIYGESTCFKKFKQVINNDTNTILKDDLNFPSLSCDIDISIVSEMKNESQRKADAADKKILVDMCMFGFDNMKDNIAPVSVLISSDIDFKYCIEEIRKRGIYTILIHRKHSISSFVDSSDMSVEWNSLARGINTTPEIRLVADKWEKDVLEAIDKLLEEKILIKEQTLRSKLRLDGRGKTAKWNEVLKLPGILDTIKKAQEDQQNLQSYDPEEASWDNFTISQLRQLYQLITLNPNHISYGKYPMALYFRKKLSEIVTNEKKPLDEKYPTGLLLEFVELCIQANWMSRSGRKVKILPTVLQEFPYHQIFNPQLFNQESISKTISLNHAKAALQFYFQKTLKNLPVYESTRGGLDHCPEYTSSVRVDLVGNFVDSYFFAQGVSTNKKEAEKKAAQEACNIILKRYIPDYKFPEEFFE